MFKFLLHLRFCGKMLILCVLMKAQVTRKKVILHLSCVHEFCLRKCWERMAIFHLHEIRTNIDVLSTEKCRVTFGLNYFAVHIYAVSVVILFYIALLFSDPPTFLWGL